MLRKYGLFYILLVLTAFFGVLLFNTYMAFHFYGDQSAPSSYVVLATVVGCLVHYLVMRQRGVPAVSAGSKSKLSVWIVLLEGAMIGALLGGVAGGIFIYLLAVQASLAEFGGLVWLFLPTLLIGGTVVGAVLGVLAMAVIIYFRRRRKTTS